MANQSDRLKSQAQISAGKPDAGRPLSEFIPAIADELTEALTAIANYLAASRTLLEPGNPSELDKVQSALEKAHAQTTRAATAVRRLQHLAAVELGTGDTDNS